MSIKILPSNLSGTVTIPPSKSMAHRMIICAGLSNKPCTVSNVALSDDIKATINAFKTLGKSIEISGDTCHLSGSIKAPLQKINCNESGSTLRFIIPIISTLGGGTIVGKETLSKRPLTVYKDIFKLQGLNLIEGFPLKIEKGLKADTFSMRGDISSQFISGLMLSAPLLNGDVKIKISTKLESKAYVDMTIMAMKTFGINVEVIKSNQEYFIRANQSYNCANVRVEGDWSQSAFWILAGVNSKEGITIRGLNMDSLQGDKTILQIAQTMGANIQVDDNQNIHIKAGKLNPSTIDISQVPDLAPCVAGMMSLTNQQCTLTGCARLKIKESNRIDAIVNVINDCGGHAVNIEDTIIVSKKTTGGNVETCNDHRIAMMTACLAPHMQSEVIMDDETVVKKSYPNFWQHYETLGGKYVQL